MSDPQRQHPVAAITKALDVIRDNFITILIVLFIGGGDGEIFLVYWILGMIVFLLVWGVISWYRFSFQVTEGELHIEQGVLIRKKLYLTSDRIQVIDISAGVVQRLFGLVAVEIKTAGSTSKEAKISALTRDKAEALKKQLRPAADEKKIAEPDGDGEDLPRTYTLALRDLLITAGTSGRMGVVLSIVGAAFSQIDQIISDDQIYRFIENHIPQSTSASLIALSILAVLVISWIFSFLSSLIANYDFKLEVRAKELIISRGLFEQTQLTIPFNRIQAVQIREELLRQPFGYVSLVVESAGYGERQGNSATLFPLIRREEMYHFLEDVLPEYNVSIDAKGKRPPRRSLRRYLLRMIWWALPVILILWTIAPDYGVYALFLLVPALLLGYQQYRDAGIRSYENHTMVLNMRLLSKTTVVIKKYRMQATELKRNPFQSRLQLHDFTVHVASGNQGRSFTARDFDEQDAQHYWEWFFEGDDRQPKMIE